MTVFRSESFESFTKLIHSKTLTHSGAKQVTVKESHLNDFINRLTVQILLRMKRHYRPAVLWFSVSEQKQAK